MSREGSLRVEGNILEAMLQQGLLQGERTCERSIAGLLFEVHASPTRYDRSIQGLNDAGPSFTLVTLIQWNSYVYF